MLTRAGKNEQVHQADRFKRQTVTLFYYSTEIPYSFTVSIYPIYQVNTKE